MIDERENVWMTAYGPLKIPPELAAEAWIKSFAGMAKVCGRPASELLPRSVTERFDVWLASETRRLAEERKAATETEESKVYRDAKRYRWLRAHGACPFAETDEEWESPEALDKAIDKRMAKSPETA